ncbi:MAG TPA: amino acid adenylation domain-containing protein, partial [Desulfuromonadaceae bacterium]|nr:amino acid adenylation domain-containing protein [Desulfuromonadaceae bacterium]
NFEYNTDLFDGATIERMVGHFRTLLEGIVANAEQKVSMLPLLTEGERRLMIDDWNSAAADYPKDKRVHQLFEEQAARTPEAVALVFDEAQMTYRELNERADRFAAHLRALGVGPETRVGICVERSFNMLVGVMGILKAGGGYVPLDPTYPAERLQFMLEDAQAPVLVTQGSLREHLKFQISNLKIIYIDELDESQTPGSKLQTPNPEPNSELRSPSSENLCYVIYTSGSTGQPKGVMVTHRNVVNLFAGLDRLLGPEPGVWIAVCSMSFDLSVTEFFYTLARGSKVVIKPDSERVQSILHGNGATTTRLSLPELMVRHGVTHWQSSVSMMRSLALMPGAEKAIRPLKKVLLGGEPLSVAFAKQLKEMMDGDLINLCGPTETTVWCQAFPVAEVGETNPLPIGRPFVNTQMYIVDRHLQPVPMGVPGEIYIAGDCVSRGYLNRPELTAKKYLPNPFSVGVQAPACPGNGAEGDTLKREVQHGDRIYASGDVGRFRADGVIEIIGRSDFQVKIRGHRVELGEIELALTKHPAVQEAVVMAQELSPGDKRLVAYPVLKPNGNGRPALEVAELRKFLEGQLPEIMVPSAFVFLDKLPLTPSGKVNRKALPAPEPPRANGGVRYSAPVSELEQSIAKIWQELLHVEKIGLQDNFFDLGGHSLLVVEAQARLHQVLGYDLPVVKLFQYPTISSLATFLREKKNDSFEKVHERCRLRHAAHGRQPEEEKHLP